MSPYVIYAIIAVGLYTAYMAIVNLFRADRMKKRVDTAGTGEMFQPGGESGTPAFAGFCESMVKLTGVDPGTQKDLVFLLAQAGITSPHAVSYYLFVKRIVQPVLLLIGTVWFLKIIVFSGHAKPMAKLFSFLVAFLLMVAGAFGAKIYVTNKKQSRQAVLMHSFPELMDLLLVCIESGLGLDAAIARVCRELHETHPVITQEMERTRMELTMLADRPQALQNLADRTEILPFKSLVSALIQTEKFGTSLVDTLRVLSEDQRTMRLLNAENRAAKLPVLITVPIILFVFLPFFLVIILGPPIVRVIEQGGIFGAQTPNTR